MARRLPTKMWVRGDAYVQYFYRTRREAENMHMDGRIGRVTIVWEPAKKKRGK